MNKMRVVFAEVEGSDEVIHGLISQLAGRMNQVAEPAPIAAAPLAAPPTLPAARAKRAIGRPRKGVLPPPLPANNADVASDTIEGRILTALAKRPMTTGDLAAAIGSAFGSVCDRLSKMRKAGSVVTQSNPNGIGKVNALVR